MLVCGMIAAGSTVFGKIVVSTSMLSMVSSFIRATNSRIGPHSGSRLLLLGWRVLALLRALVPAGGKEASVRKSQRVHPAREQAKEHMREPVLKQLHASASSLALSPDGLSGFSVQMPPCLLRVVERGPS